MITAQPYHVIGLQDLFGVSMMIPLYPKLIRNLGASPFLAGLIGNYDLDRGSKYTVVVIK